MDSSCREAEATSSLRHSGSGRPVPPPFLQRQVGRPSASILTTPPPSPLEGLPSVALPTPSQTAMHCLWPPCRDPPHPPPRGGLRQPPHVFSPIPPPPREAAFGRTPHRFQNCQGRGRRPHPTSSHHHTAREAAFGSPPHLLTTPALRPSRSGRRPPSPTSFNTARVPHVLSPPASAAGA